MKKIAIIQARFTSSRLPGKVLMPIEGRPMLGWVVERVRRARSLDETIVATTTDASDDALAAYCEQADYAYRRGSLYDVLDRFYQIAHDVQAGVIVRITADCPFIDPAEIDRTVAEFLKTGADFAANRLPPPWKRTYPIGLDIEVSTFSALERAWREAQEPYQREHVMPYLYMNSPVFDVQGFQGFNGVQTGQFRVLYLNDAEDHGELRWTVDTAADLELVRRIAHHFAGRDDFTWREVLEYYNAQPELAEINADIVHKNVNDYDQRGYRG